MKHVSSFIVVAFFSFTFSLFALAGESKLPPKYQAIPIPKGATLGELAEAYNKSSEELLALNPELKKFGLIAGNSIIIPVYSNAYVTALEQEKSRWEGFEKKYLEEISGQEKEIRKLNETDLLRSWIDALLILGSIGFVFSRVQIARMRAKKARHYSLDVRPQKGYFAEQEAWVKKRFGSTL